MIASTGAHRRTLGLLPRTYHRDRCGSPFQCHCTTSRRCRRRRASRCASRLSSSRTRSRRHCFSSYVGVREDGRLPARHRRHHRAPASAVPTQAGVANGVTSVVRPGAAGVQTAARPWPYPRRHPHAPPAGGLQEGRRLLGRQHVARDWGKEQGRRVPPKLRVGCTLQSRLCCSTRTRRSSRRSPWHLKTCGPSASATPMRAATNLEPVISKAR